MKKFTVKGNYGADFALEGEDFEQAVETGFRRIAKAYEFGDAGGYKLISAKAKYREGILGGTGGIELEVQHVGLGLTPAGKRTTKVWIYAKPEDLPEPFEFRLR